MIKVHKKTILILQEFTDHLLTATNANDPPEKKNNLKHLVAYDHGCLVLAEAIYQSPTLSVKYHILSRCSVSTWVSTSLSVLT